MITQNCFTFIKSYPKWRENKSCEHLFDHVIHGTHAAHFCRWSQALCHQSLKNRRETVAVGMGVSFNCFALWQYRFTKKHQYFFYAQPQGQMTTDHSDRFTSCEHVWFSDKITDQSQHVWFSNKRTDLPQHVWCHCIWKEEVRCHNKTRWSITECLMSKQKKWPHDCTPEALAKTSNQWHHVSCRNNRSWPMTVSLTS